MNSDSAKSEEIKAEFPNSESISHQVDQEVNNSHSVENNVDAGNSAKSEEIKAEFSKSESVFHQVDQEVNNSNSGDINPDFADHKVESDPVIPNSELNSVIAFLKGNSAAENPESNMPNGGESGSILSDLPSADLELLGQKVDHNIQVQLKTEGERLLLILPTESQVSPSEFNWWEIWQQMKQRLNAGDRLRKPNTSLHLVAKDRLLDNRQLQDLAETLNTYQIQLKSVATSRRQTAIAACTLGYSVEQTQLHTSLTSDIQPTPSALADALYLQMTVRSGVEIRHPGTVVILGDINPSGIVIADGDILIWGRLRGVAHAGAGGNRESLIMALQMEPTQLRIADAVARSPEKTLTSFFPEVAHITSEGIRIVKAADFSRSQLSSRTQLVTQNLI
ncbi:septum site-determining protein MinC [Dolichospermum sp. UHCC 0684]|jgi:septum site-determining protein MinC|uniref:septum site-determining protein MinC n=1 Tax=unclassified Dolichospermum TaxID=2622029 RepID=UPI001580AFD8|nr:MULTISPECIES: septum site-determining protein MinC [unclassified Dolichospermum]MEA5531624.1 septum site-determining protein MinC [Dolichospermum sp. UHCC 0684]